MDPYLATVLNCSFWLIYGLPFVHPERASVQEGVMAVRPHLGPRACVKRAHLGPGTCAPRSLDVRREGHVSCPVSPREGVLGRLIRPWDL